MLLGMVIGLLTVIGAMVIGLGYSGYLLIKDCKEVFKKEA